MSRQTTADYTIYNVDVLNSGELSVYVQGSLTDAHGKTVFLTVHDVGNNQMSWIDFVNHESMDAVREHSIFLHICIPGQEDSAEPLADEYIFPTLDELAYDIAAVIEHFNFKAVVALGEGAGANIVARLAVTHPARILGIILVHCTSTTAGIKEYLTDKFINYQLTSVGMTSVAWDYLKCHKFGQHASADSEAVDDFTGHLQTSINPGNLSRYLSAFLNRTDLSNILGEQLNVPALLVVGAKASHLHTVYTMQQAMKAKDTTLLQVGNVGDCLTED